MVMFDLPVTTKENRRNYRRFVDKLEDDGYTRIQFSIYVRPSATDENAQVHYSRLINWLPPLGEVRVLKFTDKQWARMTVFFKSQRVNTELPPEQLVFFDEDLTPVDRDMCEEVDHRLLVMAAEKRAPYTVDLGETEPTISPSPVPSTTAGAKRGKKAVRKSEPQLDFWGED